MIWRACRCRENELVFTRDLGTGSLLSTFSVGRTEVMEGGVGCSWRGEWRRRRRVEYDKTETCPQVPVGPGGTIAVIPLHCNRLFLSPFKSILFCFLLINLFLVFSLFFSPGFLLSLVLVFKNSDQGNLDYTNLVLYPMHASVHL